jgi:Tfp pilus assembly protein PilO
MNKLDKYLNTLSSKEILYLFLSIPILFFIIYYQFIYNSILNKTNKLKRKEKIVHRNFVKVSRELNKLKNINVSFKSYQIKVNSLREDYKFIKYNIDSIRILKLTNKKIYTILTNLLNFSKKENIDISISLNKNKPLKPFTKSISIVIEGEGKYLNIVRFLSYIESQPILCKIKYLKILKEKENVNKTENFMVLFDIVGAK